MEATDPLEAVNPMVPRTLGTDRQHETLFCVLK